MKVSSSFEPTARSRPPVRLVGLRGYRALATTFVLPLLIASAARAQSKPHMEQENEKVYGFVLFDVLEAAPAVEGGPLGWDMSASIGKEYDRLWIKSDGELSTSRRAGRAEFQALYSRLVAAYWEAQVGVRIDGGYAGGKTNTRGQLVVGLQGLAPYLFKVEPAVFISDQGDISASLTGTYDLFVTQRLILQPRLDVAAALQEVEQWGVSSGLNSVGLSARLRYEIRREFAPYVGISWTRRTGGAADLSRLEGEDTSTLSLVAGVRLWR